MVTKPFGVYTIAIITLGCAKNEVDSRTMSNRLAEQGFVIGEDPEHADFILLNTCAFIEAATEESIDTILELAALERVQNGTAKLLVAGCLPSRFGDELVCELPEVTAFVPVAEEGGLVELVHGLTRQIESVQKQSDMACSKDNTESSAILDSCEHIGKPIKETSVFSEWSKTTETAGALNTLATIEQPWAYVKISDGCSRCCSYCTIPTIRGSYHSYSLGQITSEIKDLVDKGVCEIILVGQDTGLWSEPASDKELPAEIDVEHAASSVSGTPPKSLAQLLDVLAEQYPQTWFRVMYLQPEGITDELLKVMAAHTNIARYLDIPLQHASPTLLKAMNRKGSGVEYLALLDRIRDALPGVVLRTTVMSGFPGEGQEEFNELYTFLKAARFDYVGIFSYSRESGTVAAELPEQVEHDIAAERAQELRDLADSIGIERASAQIGKEVDVLICGHDDEGLFGRTQSQAPEVDGITYLVPSNDRISREEAPFETAMKPGSIVSARIGESVLYDLFAEVF